MPAVPAARNARRGTVFTPTSNHDLEREMSILANG